MTLEETIDELESNLAKGQFCDSHTVTALIVHAKKLNDVLLWQKQIQASLSILNEELLNEIKDLKDRVNSRG